MREKVGGRGVQVAVESVTGAVQIPTQPLKSHHAQTYVDAHANA